MSTTTHQLEAGFNEIRSFRFKEQIAEISKIRVRQIFDAAAADSNFFPKICLRKNMSEFDLGLNFNFFFLNMGQPRPLFVYFSL